MLDASKRRRTTRRRLLPLINALFCHELFAHVFLMLSHKDLVEASRTCSLWRRHIQEMQGALFRRFYAHLGGDPYARRGVEWRVAVREVLQCETDLAAYAYAVHSQDEALRESILSDGGFCMDLCNHIVRKGGSITPAQLMLDFKKRLATQNAKLEICDIVDALCVQQEVDGEERFFLRPCVDNGNLIKQIRKLFLESKQRVGTLKVVLFITDFLIEKKLPPDNHTKMDIWNIIKILATLTPDQQDEWMLKKLNSTKHL